MPRGRAAVMAVIGVYNLVQNLWLPRAAYVPANAAVACGLVALARRHGCSWDDLGLDPSKTRDGVKIGLAAASIATALAAHASTRRSPYLLDERAVGSRRDHLFNAAVRFPLGTAAFEEMVFRGVVYATWRKDCDSARTGSLAAATLFGLWHLIPTARSLAGNPVLSRLGSTHSRVAVVVTGAVLTGLASLGFGWLRERSGSLVAPWLAHAAINSAGYLAGASAWRRHLDGK